MEQIPKRAYSKKVTFQKGTFQKEHIPNRAHSNKGTFHLDHIPKRAHSKKGAFQKGAHAI